MATTTNFAPPQPGGAPAPEDDGAAQQRPERSYLALMTVFNAAFAGALAVGRERLPERIPAGDLALMSVGTYKLSRTIAKARVTRPIRAPFTDVQGPAGPAELDERARGRGLRRAVGELLLCPYCLEQWVAGGFVAGMVFSPRVTRAVASMFTVVAGADVMQHGYRRMQDSL